MLEGFENHHLGGTHDFFCGQVPSTLLVGPEEFEDLWSIHPEDFHDIMMHGKLRKTPRWQQAYGKDYHYTGRVNEALPVLPVLQPYLDWVQTNVNNQLNGILLNWYDASLGHYIGKHRDSTVNMIPNTPIVTISFGEERIFRLRPWKQDGYEDFVATHGRVFVMPWETNLAWTHEVPARKPYNQRRISLTFRAFADG